jgi:uncharacterized protein
MIVYLHGFLSSPASVKARLLTQYLNQHSRGEQLIVPEIPPDPQTALKVIEDAISPCATLIGSSLGGYYATWFAERRGNKAVLVNPAVRPYELLKNYLGIQKNLYTGEEFVVTAQHLHDLHDLDVATISEPKRYLLLVQTGDEVLDYREAVEKYRSARQIVIEGGDHSFQRFEAHIPEILEFAGL